MTHDTLIKHLQALKLDGTRIDKIEIEWKGSKVDSLKIFEYSIGVVYPTTGKSTGQPYKMSAPVQIGTRPRNALNRMGIITNEDMINEKLTRGKLFKMSGVGRETITKILEYRDKLIENMDLNLMEENG